MNQDTRAPPPEIHKIGYDGRHNMVYLETAKGFRVEIPYHVAFPNVLRGPNAFIHYIDAELNAGRIPAARSRFSDVDFELILQRHFY